MSPLADTHQSISHTDQVFGFTMIVIALGVWVIDYVLRVRDDQRDVAEQAGPVPEDWATCVDCKGSGVTGTDEREPETGQWVTQVCSSCSGDGTVDPAWVSTCDNCQDDFWDGDGCEHVITSCGPCREFCAECQTEALDDAAYDAVREHELLGDFR